MANDIYLYSKPQKGAKKTHQSRERSKAREQQQMKQMRETDPRREKISRA